MAKKTGLGRGYEALLSDNSADENAAVTVRTADIVPNRQQPRKNFDKAALDELAENIAAYGLLQPILVRPQSVGGYQIVAGERRWRACMQAGLSEIPVIIKELNDAQTAEVALIENLQREDLNAIEQANGFALLINKYGLTQEQAAQRVGKSRSAVANTLRLLELGKYTKYVEDGTVSAGHARAMLSLSSDAERDLAVDMIKRGASVRDIERMAKNASAEHKKPRETTQKSIFFREVEAALTQELGRKVSVSGGDNGGRLVMEFYSQQDLQTLINTMFGEK